MALRKLAVISIADKVAADPNYHLTAADVRAWERTNGMIPPGSVVMVRSDWSKRWPDAVRILPADHKFPGATPEAIKLVDVFAERGYDCEVRVGGRVIPVVRGGLL